MAYILDGLILAVIGVVLDRSRWRKARRDRRILCWLMYGYVCCVLAVTLMPFQLPIPGREPLVSPICQLDSLPGTSGFIMEGPFGR